MPAENRKQVQEELEDLQLQEARAQAQQRQVARTQQKARSRALEFGLKRDQANQATIQAACAHRKGGKGTAQLYQGNDHNYSLVTHTYSHGPTGVICQRCTKEWLPPAPLPKNATKEQRLQYKADLAEYRRMLNLPTDNEPSGTVLFAFSEPDQDAA